MRRVEVDARLFKAPQILKVTCIASEFTNERVPVNGSNISPMELKMSHFIRIAQM